MEKLGQWQELKVLKKSEFGCFLEADANTEVLLPKRYCQPDLAVGDLVKVFLCLDSEDRPIAVTTPPKIQVGEFAKLKVVSQTPVGAFLDWGLPKDLLLPFAEQTRPLRIGMEIIVFAYLDKSGRISATMRLERNVPREEVDYEEEQQVELLIIGKTDLGYKAIINGKHLGLIYEKEVFQTISYGQKISGFIKQVRLDGKIDLCLQKAGREVAVEIADRIMQKLNEQGGFLAINDKTPADEIHNLFGVSRKKYKIALGGLYKKRLITVDDDGIRLPSMAKAAGAPTKIKSSTAAAKTLATKTSIAKQASAPTQPAPPPVAAVAQPRKPARFIVKSPKK